MTTYLICPIAVPGAGKSHLAAALVDEGLLAADAIVSPDSFRVTLTGSRNDQSANGDAFAISHRIAKARLSRGLDVFFDATHLTEGARSTMVGFAAEHDATLVWVAAISSLTDAAARNAERPDDLRVPDDVMASMSARYMALDLSGLARSGLLSDPSGVREILASASGSGATVRGMK